MNIYVRYVNYLVDSQDPYEVAWNRRPLALEGLCKISFNPLTHGPLWPPLSHGPQADLPYKNRADLPEARELQAIVIAALALRVS